MAEIFPEQAADLAEVVFLVRDDMDTKANIQKKYNWFDNNKSLL